MRRKFEELSQQLQGRFESILHDYTHNDGGLICFQYQLERRLHESSVTARNSLLSFSWECREYLWRKLHSSPWNDCSLQVFREWFGLITCLLVLTSCNDVSVSECVALIHLTDLGMLLSSPMDPLLQGVMDALYEEYRRLKEVSDGVLEEVLRGALVTQSRRCKVPSNFLTSAMRLEVSRIEGGELLRFYEEFFVRQRPVVITGLMDSWTAPRLWSDISYLLHTTGERTVPVELGSSYLSSGAAMKLMTIEAFIKQHLLYCEEEGEGEGESKEVAVGYLAQHALFEQIPSLKRDFNIPDHCSLLIDQTSDSLPSDEEEKEVLVQSWLGSVGTVSPTHYDSYHNLLAQVVGSKAVRLFPPQASASLRPMGGKMKNNSTLDLQKEDDLSLLSAVPCCDVVLREGESLFIPRWWWHYVTAIDRVSADSLNREKEIRHSNSHNVRESHSHSHIDSHSDRHSHSHSDKSCVDFSFSINFWWGKRVEPDS